MKMKPMDVRDRAPRWRRRARVAARVALAVLWLASGIGLVACEQATPVPTVDGFDPTAPPPPTDTLVADACAGWPATRTLGYGRRHEVSWISSTNRNEPLFVPGRVLVSTSEEDYLRIVEPALADFRPAGLDRVSQIAGCLPALTPWVDGFPLPPLATIPTLAVSVTDVAGAVEAIYERLCDELPGCADGTPPAARGDNSPVPYVAAQPDWTTGLRSVIQDPLNGAVPIKPAGIDLPSSDMKQRFIGQWALMADTTPGNTKGIRLLEVSAGSLSRNTTVTINGQEEDILGTGSQIVLFDTSPYDTVTQTISWAPTRTQLAAGSSSATFDLVVESPNAFGHAAGDKYSSHGLFVAGMAYAVAPDATFRLIEVLGDNGFGTYSDLLDAIATYLVENGQFAESTPLPQTVINLSLGYTDTQTVAIAEPLRTQLVGTLTAKTGTHPTKAELMKLLSTVPGTAATQDTIGQFLALARDMGAVVIAASGNDSGHGGWANSDGAQHPARFTSTVAVAALNGVSSNGALVKDRRSCFANQGQLLAPGGGVADTNALGTGDCPAETKAATIACRGHSNCAEAVMGLVDPGMAETENTDFSSGSFSGGYAYWEGSSFSAGLVSGLAALAFERLALEQQTPVAPADVEQRLNCAATGSLGPLPIVNAADGQVTPAGVVNVRTWRENCG